MIIKVCGLNAVDNLMELCTLDIDMVGYNFYPLSPRFVDQPLPEIPPSIKKVGVFVNAEVDYISQKITDYRLDYAQLHGDESSAFALSVQKLVPVIKVFRIDENFDWKIINEFNTCNYFLFDTATKHFGGSGLKFDWDQLKSADIQRPFLLSGGIGPDDLDRIKNFNHPFFVGIDINSKFEMAPGKKDVTLIDKFLSLLNH